MTAAGSSGPPTQQERLAAAVRVLAAAEEAFRSGRTSAGVDPVATEPSATEPSATQPSAAQPTAATETARRWVEGLVDPGSAGSTGWPDHLDLSGLSGGDEPGSGRARAPGRGRGSPRVGRRSRDGAPPPPDPATRGDEPDPVSVARQIVLRQLTMGPRTRKQLADKLRERDCDDDVATAVLDRMTAVGLVDDQAYAEMLVRSKQAGRGLAQRALAQELRQKGVDDETVSQALGSIDPESERARAEMLAAKKMRTMSGLDPQVQSRRLSGMLARKGYPPSVVYAVVRDAVNDAPEHQRD